MNKTAFQIQSPKQFAVYLRALRRSRGLTQGDLGRLIGVTGARISEIEKDPSAVGLTQVLKLLHILGARAVVELNHTKLLANRQTHALGEW